MRSKFEKKVAAKLKRLSQPFSYEDGKYPYILRGNYIPDFVLPNGTVIEVKGYLDYDDRRKMLAVKEANPNLKIVFLFMKPHQKMSKRQQTHAEWAEEHGFEWIDIDKLNKKWLKQLSGV